MATNVSTADRGSNRLRLSGRCIGPHAPRPSARCRTLEALRAATQSAEAVARLKGEFLSFAAHDLIQPVQALELTLDAIERHAPAASEIERLTASGRASVARMRELLKMLLEISRIESGALSLDEQPIPVGEMFCCLERQFGSVARSKELAFLIEPSDHVVQTDPMLLRGMLGNLVGNAIRYTASGEVRLQSSVRADGALCLAVHDTGIGIPDGELESIFRDFHRLEAARCATHEGFGLGLGIVRRLSSLLDFPVTVRSSIGRGSTFCVEIPPGRVFAAP